MAGELNGTNAILYMNYATFDVIAGQVELTSALNATPIDISAKGDNDFVRIMDGELAAKGKNITLNIIYSNDATFRDMREKMINGTNTGFKIDFSAGAGDAEIFTGMITNMADTLPLGDKVTSSITILSLGPVLEEQ